MKLSDILTLDVRKVDRQLTSVYQIWSRLSIVRWWFVGNSYRYVHSVLFQTRKAMYVVFWATQNPRQWLGRDPAPSQWVLYYSEYEMPRLLRFGIWQSFMLLMVYWYRQEGCCKWRTFLVAAARFWFSHKALKDIERGSLMSKFYWSLSICSTTTIPNDSSNVFASAKCNTQ